MDLPIPPHICAFREGRSVDVRTIGRELGVQSVLEGSIRRAGNRVRITAQLIDATSGGHLWVVTALRDFTGFLKASIIKKPPGVVAR